MELWFWASVGSALFAGISNVYFKIAAARGYSAEVFSLLGSVLTVTLVVLINIVFPEQFFGFGWVSMLLFVGGFIAATTGIMKVYALRYIDTTIYFPLFKLLAPLLAIVMGVTLFDESFTLEEWLGLAIGLVIPLLLITKAENHRQNNLLAGLLLILVTGVFSAGVAAINKFGIDLGISVFVTFLYMALGLLVGNIISVGVKNGFGSLFYSIISETSNGLVIAAGMRALLISISVALTLFAYAEGGPLAITQTIHSMYILIPIVLSIIFYNEHWNTQKVIAIVLSIAALGLLG